MKKLNQNHGYPISNGLLNFAHTFCHTCKTHAYGIFILQCVNLMCLKLWDIGWIMFKKLKIHWMNGMWF
jgi:hypothetical protein